MQVRTPKGVTTPRGIPGFRKTLMKVVVIGDSGVGKTSLIQMYEHNKFSQNFKPTIGADFSNKELIIDDRMIIL